MIKSLQLKNVGPSPAMSLDFSSRLNIITGDNGLGKSFILDICWWALTRKWPFELNDKLSVGRRAIPHKGKEGKILFSFSGKSKREKYESIYKPKEEAWTGRTGRPANPGLVLYAMSDGSFAVWDPARNYWKKDGDIDVSSGNPAYVFSSVEVWEGLKNDKGNWSSNGLIRDWGSWQKENGKEFANLVKVLETLSSTGEKIEPGKLTRLEKQDARDIPTVNMPYNQEVAVIHASSGMRRIMALAYLLVWAWAEHERASEINREPVTNQIVFLIDEIESHLHPRWQRKIVPAILSVMDSLAPTAEIQLIAATHSPLIMTSIEPSFNTDTDTWFDLDFENGDVLLRKREFEKMGDAEMWLLSEAFDLSSTRPLPYEQLLNDASVLLRQDNPPKEEIATMNQKLAAVLNPKDIFWLNWRNVCEKKGLS